MDIRVGWFLKNVQKVGGMEMKKTIIFLLVFIILAFQTLIFQNSFARETIEESLSVEKEKEISVPLLKMVNANGY